MDLVAELHQRGLVSPALAQEVARLRPSGQGQAVPLPQVGPLDLPALNLLAAGFSLGQPGSPAIPYRRLG